jgi:hypothetical protein
MNKSNGKYCGRVFIAAVTFSLFSVPGSWAQDSNSSGAMGGLRGPQDIINSVNNRDSYGNPMPNVPGTYGSPTAGAESAGSIQPFTNAGDPSAGSQGAYLPPPAAGAAGAPGAGSNYSSVQGNTPPFQGGPPQSYKAHNHHKKQTAFQQSQAGSQFNGQPGQYPNPNPQDQPGQQGYNAGGYPNVGGGYPNGGGGYPNPGMSGPPDATQYHAKGGGGGNNSLGGAVVGVPDRAAKTAVGGSLKAGKEVLKALF